MPRDSAPCSRRRLPIRRPGKRTPSAWQPSQRYPEAKKFLAWRAAAPAPASFSGVEFFGINAFYLVDTQGQRQAVRWSMRSQVPFQPLANEQRQAAPHDFLFDDMRQKLAQQPLHWDLMMQLAQPGDPVDDPPNPGHSSDGRWWLAHWR